MRIESPVRLFRPYLPGLFALAVLSATNPVCANGIQSAEVLFPELKEIMETALRKSPRMISENLDLLEAEQLRYVSSSGLYPDAGGYVQFLQQRESRLQSDGSTESVNLTKVYYAATVTQPLYHWGALRARAEIGKIRAEIEQNNVVEAYRKLALEIRRSYLDLIIGKASLQAVEQGVVMGRDRIELHEVAVELGAESKSILSSAQTELKRAELSRDRAVRDFEKSVLLFRRLTGISEFQVSDVPDEIPPINLPQVRLAEVVQNNYVEQNGFENDSRYVADKLRLQSERLNESINRSNLRPKLNLQAGLLQDERSDTVNVADRYEYTALFAGVSVNWKIFDGFESRGYRLAAAARAQKIENRMAETADSLVQTVEEAVSDLEFARRSLEFSEKGLRGAVAAVARAREDYEIGQVSANAIADAETRELSARLSAFRERAAYLRAAAELLSSVGADPVVEGAIPQILKQ